MDLQNLKLFFRNIHRNPFFASINILGLSLGIACFVITMIYINYHLGFDSFHENSGQIYTVTTTINFNDFRVEDQETTPAPLAAALLNNYPEVLKVARINQLMEVVVKSGDKLFKEKNVRYADSSFFEIFSYQFIEGDPKTALKETNTGVITESIAHKYFGNEQALGKVLEFYGRKFIITAVVKDPPQNSIITFDMLFSLHTFKYYYNSPTWDNANFLTYFVLQKNVNPKTLEAKFPELLAKNLKQVDGIDFKVWLTSGNQWKYNVRSLKEIYLDVRGNRVYLMGFGLIAFFLLTIACINYANLNTATALKRAKEVGVRKSVGADKNSLVRKFLGESLLLSFISLLLAMGMVEALLPFLSGFINTRLAIHYFDDYYTLPFLIALALVVGLLSGLYPAFVMSAFNPVKVLKGSLSRVNTRFNLRNLLVFLQFSISTGLIICLIIVYQQTRMMMKNNPGFDMENVLVINNAMYLTNRNNDPMAGSCNTDAVRAEFMKIPEVNSIAFSGRTFDHTEEMVQKMVLKDGRECLMNWIMCDPDFLETMGIKMHSGRFFDRASPADLRSVVMNLTAAKYLGWENNAIGKTFEFPPLGEFKVIGIMNDFNYQPLQYEIKPVLFLNHEGPAFYGVNYLNVKLNKPVNQEIIKRIQAVWEKFAPEIQFEYFSMSDQNKINYIKEERTQQLLMILTLLILFITYLGIYGLATYSAMVKMKEIAIRKIMGATVTVIIFKMTWSFTKIVLVANIIAWPVAWYFMNNWLSKFATRITISWWIFVLAALLSYLLAIATIIFQAYAAARKNPVEVLRYE